MAVAQHGVAMAHTLGLVLLIAIAPTGDAAVSQEKLPAAAVNHNIRWWIGAGRLSAHTPFPLDVPSFPNGHAVAFFGGWARLCYLGRVSIFAVWCNCVRVVLSAWLLPPPHTLIHATTTTHAAGARFVHRRAAGVVNLQIAAGDTVTWNWERAGGEDQWAGYHNLIGETGPDGVVWGSIEVSDSAS
jgi:hypothetical protein